MEKIIKFRVWEKPQFNDNPDGSPAVSFSGKMWNDNDPKFWASCLMNEKDEYILMQYTGLRDMEGKELYLDDVVEDWEGIDRYLVIWNHLYACFELERLTHRNDTSQDIFDAPNGFSIVGNAHENPELLSESNAEATKSPQT